MNSPVPSTSTDSPSPMLLRQPGGQRLRRRQGAVDADAAEGVAGAALRVGFKTLGAGGDGRRRVAHLESILAGQGRADGGRQAEALRSSRRWPRGP